MYIVHCTYNIHNIHAALVVLCTAGPLIETFLDIVQTFELTNFKVWTVLSTDDIYNNNTTKCPLSYLVQ